MLRAREISFTWILIFYSQQLHPDENNLIRALLLAQYGSIATHECMEDTNTQFKPLCMWSPIPRMLVLLLHGYHPSVSACFPYFLDNLPKVPRLDLMPSQNSKLSQKMTTSPSCICSDISASTKLIATKREEMYLPFHDDVLRVQPNPSPQTIIKWMNKEMSFTKWHRTLKQ